MPWFKKVLDSQHSESGKSRDRCVLTCLTVIAALIWLYAYRR